MANECARDRDWEMQAVRASFRLIIGVSRVRLYLSPSDPPLTIFERPASLFALRRVSIPITPPHTAHRPPRTLRFAHLSPNSKTSTPRARIAQGRNFQVCTKYIPPARLNMHT